MTENTEPTPSRGAIDRIADLSALATRAVDEVIGTNLAIMGTESDHRVPYVALPKHWAVHSIEHLNHLRSRFRGTFSTHRVDDFADYVFRAVEFASEREDVNRCITVDVNRLSAQIYIDAGTPGKPGHCEHLATCALRPTALWQSIQGHHGKRLSQRQLTDWLEDWRGSWPHALPASLDPQAEPLSQAATLASIRAITIEAKASATHTESNLAASRTALETIEARGAAGTLPDLIVFHVQPYIGLDTRTVTMQLQVHREASPPALSVRIVALDALVESIADEFTDKVHQAVLKRAVDRKDDREWPVLLGSFVPAKA